MFDEEKVQAQIDLVDAAIAADDLLAVSEARDVMLNSFLRYLADDLVPSYEIAPVATRVSLANLRAVAAIHS